MRIIVLQEMPDKGKTSTIWIIRDLLLRNNGISLPNQFQIFGSNPIPFKDDFKDIIMYNNLKVAIYSVGDYSNYLVNAIYDYDSQGCDVMVCALSTNTAKVRANNTLNRFNANRINKTITPNATAELATNTADAQKLFNLI